MGHGWATDLYRYTHPSLMQLKNQWGQCPLKIDNRANEISFWLKCESFRVTQCCNFRVQLVSLTQVSRLSAWGEPMTPASLLPTTNEDIGNVGELEESCAQARHPCQRHKLNKEAATWHYSEWLTLELKINLIGSAAFFIEHCPHCFLCRIEDGWVKGYISKHAKIH